MKKENKKRSRGRPGKAAPVTEEKKKTDLVEPSQPAENSPKGIITEDEILRKAESIRATGDELPEEEQTEIEPGPQLEEDLIKLAAGEESPGEAEGSTGEQINKGSPAQGDAIAEMENRMLLAPIEAGFDLPEGMLMINEGDQALLAMVRPDDLEIKKSPENYWTVLGLLNVSKFIGWGIYSWRKKKEAKKKAEEKAKQQQEPDEELTRSHAAGK